jgi:glycosyltransferase involved in cell wall biosynthesis/tetratricopeptide (TPR) repeat protein
VYPTPPEHLRRDRFLRSILPVIKRDMNKIEKNIASYSVRDLLKMHGETFLSEAYRMLLGRQPDAEGKAYYLSRLRSGKSKLEVIWQLHNSPEGRAYPTQLRGLSNALRRHKRHKIPLLGPIMRSAYDRRGSIFDREREDDEDAYAVSTTDPSSFKKRSLDTARGSNTQSISPVDVLLNEFKISKAVFANDVTLEQINKLNPELNFDSLLTAIRAFISQDPPSKIRFFEDDKANALLYTRVGAGHESEGRVDTALTLYLISLLFCGTAEAHESIGNISINGQRYHEAMAHYQMALKIDTNSPWLYANLARAYGATGQHKEAIEVGLEGLRRHPSSEALAGRMDDLISDYWNAQHQRLNALAAAQNRPQLMDAYEDIAAFIGESYAKFFRRTSDKPLSVQLNPKRVLIIGLTHDAAPQCFRYRMEQKVEQLEFAGYEAEMVAWHDQENAMKKINFFDIVIFYRVPAFPNVLKQAEYAKSLGKITFFEVDDLLFEAEGLPAFETYGQQMPASSYVNLTKDIGSYRAMANRCDYAIASTKPLLDRLAPLSQTGIGYLHRNGFDKHNVFTSVPPAPKSYINMFYGSGTLAHNSDFVIEAIPAITRILRRHKNVKLTVVGYLTLPSAFMAEFEKQIIRLPMVRDLGVYWSYLGASDINLAVLHDDALTACKSELKWFEAGAFCIPSVVSRTTNYLDVIDDGKDGFIVAGEEQWYQALNKLIENPDLRKQVGLKVNQRVKDEYSVAALATNIDEIMQDCIARHSVMLKNGAAAKLKEAA